MLKTIMQSQLDKVISGLNQLQSALADIIQIKQKEVYLVTLAIVLIFTTINFHGAVASSEEESEEDTCFECTTKVKASIQIVRSMTKDREPFNVTDVGPFALCQMTGFGTMSLNQDVCPKKVDVDGEICLDHNLEFLYSELKIVCESELDENPKAAADSIFPMLKDATQGFGCGDESAEEKAKMDEVEKKMNGGMTVEELRDKHCADNQNSGKAKGTIGIVWPDVKVATSLRVYPNKVIKSFGTQLLSTDMSTSKPICESSSDGFKNSCNCLLELRVIKLVLAKSMKDLFPCPGQEEKKESKKDELLKMLTCDDAK